MAKGNVIKIKLASTADTGYFYLGSLPLIATMFRPMTRYIPTVIRTIPASSVPSQRFTRIPGYSHLNTERRRFIET